MKKRIAGVAGIVILLAIISAGTYAYFATARSVRNVITTGKIDITVVEQQSTDGKMEAYPAAPIAVLPTCRVSKIVSVRCEEQSAYIRMKYSVRILDVDGTEMLDAPSVVTVTPSGAAHGWVEKDGWWYYSQSLQAGQSTTPLFEEVVFSADMGNEYQNCSVIVMVHAQSVQTANNPIPQGGITEVPGWPGN